MEKLATEKDWYKDLIDGFNKIVSIKGRTYLIHLYKDKGSYTMSIARVYLGNNRVIIDCDNKLELLTKLGSSDNIGSAQLVADIQTHIYLESLFGDIRYVL